MAKAKIQKRLKPFSGNFRLGKTLYPAASVIDGKLVGGVVEFTPEQWGLILEKGQDNLFCELDSEHVPSKLASIPDVSKMGPDRALDIILGTENVLYLQNFLMQEKAYKNRAKIVKELEKRMQGLAQAQVLADKQAKAAKAKAKATKAGK